MSFRASGMLCREAELSRHPGIGESLLSVPTHTVKDAGTDTIGEIDGSGLAKCVWVARVTEDGMSDALDSGPYPEVTDRGITNGTTRRNEEMLAFAPVAQHGSPLGFETI